jgi:hypothetical protein
MAPVIDAPVTKKAMTLGDLWGCVVHPAFRLGFLDARAGRPIDHDQIMARIFAETPAGALKRLGWSTPGVLQGPDLLGERTAETALSFELAQYRYEEGRTLYLEQGIRCKAWGHPDFPPAAVREYLYSRVKEFNMLIRLTHTNARS